jgi:DnaA-homolog protein
MSMRQLPLEIRLADHAVFENFHAAGNELTVHQVRDAATNPGGPMLWLWGAPGVGRSHLLQACTVAAGQAGRRAAFVPCHPSAGLPAGVLEGLGALDVVCLDDVDAVAGQVDWEAGLFRLFEELRQGGGRLAVTSAGPAADVAFRLPDLASRLRAGLALRVRPLDDDGRLAALQARARFRGFELPTETGHYLLSRCDRGAGSLFRVLEELDRAALAAQKRLTIPFVREVLGR